MQTELRRGEGGAQAGCDTREKFALPPHQAAKSDRDFLPRAYAGELMDRRCWKHSRQNTGRPCVGRKGTVVSFPHCEQVVLVSARWKLLAPGPGF